MWGKAEWLRSWAATRRRRRGIRRKWRWAAVTAPPWRLVEGLREREKEREREREREREEERGCGDVGPESGGVPAAVRCGSRGCVFKTEEEQKNELI